MGQRREVAAAGRVRAAPGMRAGGENRRRAVRSPQASGGSAARKQRQAAAAAQQAKGGGDAGGEPYTSTPSAERETVSRNSAEWADSVGSPSAPAMHRTLPPSGPSSGRPALSVLPRPARGRRSRSCGGGGIVLKTAIPSKADSAGPERSKDSLGLFLLVFEARSLT